MNRVLNVAEHNLFADPPRVLSPVTGTAMEALPSEVKKPTGEIAYRYIQNMGTNPMYYSFGLADAAGNPVCSATQCHGILNSGAQLDCSNHRLRVCVFVSAVGGGTVATTIIRRRDLVKTSNNPI